MFYGKAKRVFLSFLLTFSFGVWQSTQAFLPFLILAKLTEKKNHKNLILILDVKQQEEYLGACGYILATALKDKVSPIIASAHALNFVKEYFSPSEWHIFKNDNLVLFIPNDYLKNHDLKDVEHAGFDLDDWRGVFLNAKSMTGIQLYSVLAPKPILNIPFANLSHDSVQTISKTLKKDKNNLWKIYAVGHGAPDAHQVVGLNLKDFQTLLDELESRSVDFFVYQTCFGGSTNQLREIYTESQGSFKKFSFPIISGALTNSVSFGAHPDSGTTFKGLFAKVSNSMIMEQKATELLKSVNELNKGLDYASDYHWSNNLLLIRMPGKEFFEPVADNKLVFKLTEFNNVQRNGNSDAADNKTFKCLLVNHPILDEVYDFSKYSNFMIASGISRADHYIKEIKLAAKKGKSNETYFADVLDVFNSLAFPEKEKEFFIPTIRMGDAIVLTDVTITQEKCNNYWSAAQTLSIRGMAGNSFYKGEAEFAVSDGTSELMYTTIGLGSETQGQKYRADYDKVVNKHLKKQHQYPLHVHDALVLG